MVVGGGPASLLQIGVWPDDQESGARGAADANQEEIGIFFAVGWDSRIWLMTPSDVPLLKTASYSLKYWLIYNLGFKYEIFLVAEKLQTSFRNQVSISPETAKQHNPPPPQFQDIPAIITLLIIFLNTFQGNDDYHTCLMHCSTMVKHVRWMRLIPVHCCPKKRSDWATSPGYRFTQGSLLSLHKCTPCHYLLLN